MKIITIIIFVLNLLISTPFDGMTLITSMGGGQNNDGNQSRQSILIDNNENIINIWNHDTGPASIAYLMPDSILYVPCKVSAGGGQGGGPNGGRFKKMDWFGNIIWDYYLPEDICEPHHDIEILPNGNILAICSETKTLNDAINAGIESIDGTMTLDMIIEIEPIGTSEANIVWEWHFWDHLVQDFNPSLDNYGIISDNPQLLDINCNAGQGGGNGNDSGIRDWNHCNCISYNPILDQIVISSRHMSEFYVIDHSTNTEEASSHSGGLYGYGGDIIYRWGNPQNYNRGNDSSQILNSQHGVNWIPYGYPGQGNFILFNNNHSNNSSAILEIMPPLDSLGIYSINNSDAFGPESYHWIFQENFYSNSQSGVFRLPNGNTIITSANERSIFEVSSNGDLEWSYSGDLGSPRAIKYSYEYLTPALNGDLNEDSLINILDVVIILNIIFDTEYNQNADMNNDGNINILDVVGLVNIILFS